ncbi:MAG: hypothetical protein J6T23_07485 [Elusimicrobia bacterium]|nr:hypothetical protein [Elusimicrobiota bacterium]
MIELNVDNIETYKKVFERFFGEAFIKSANEYIELVKHNKDGNKKYHPFFEYWNTYNIDIKQTKEKKQLYCSVNTAFILELLSNLKDLETKYNLRNFIDNLLLPNKFYSTVFEIQIAKLYSSVYNLEILEEQPNIKTPDFKINIANGKTIYIECKSLQDFELVHNEEYSRLIDSLQKYCNKQHKSNQIIIRTGTNFNKQYTNDILTEVENLINQDKFGDFKLENLNIEISISKISNWDTPIYGNIQIIHPEQSQLSIITQVKKLPNGMMENKNIIMIGVESKPILNFKKRIEDEIK